MNPSSASALHDPARLAALHQSGLLDSAPEARFDRLTRLAARVLHAPIALLTLVDTERQFFKSFCGLDEPLATERQTPLSHSFCQHVVQRAEPLIVDRAREHPVVRDNPAIAAYGVEAYAGVPLTTRDGYVLGSLCVFDTRPRRWSEEDVALLQELAESAASEVELRRETARRQQMETHLRAEQKRLSTLVEAQLDIAQAGLDAEWIMHVSAQRARELTGAGAAVVELVDGDQMVYAACAGLAEPHVGLRLGKETSLSGLSLRTGQPLNCTDCDQDERVDREAARRVGARSMLIAPLIHNAHPLGVLKVYSPEPAAFHDLHLHLLRLFAGPVAAQLYISQQFATIEGLLAARRRAEAALRQSEQKFRSIFEEAAEGFFLVGREPDGTFRYLEANAALLRLAGLSARELIGSTPADVLPPERAARVSATYREVFDSGISTSLEQTGTLPRGLIVTHTRYHPLRDELGNVVRILGIAEDITERKQAEEALRVSEQRFRALIEHATDVITVLSADGEIRYQSPSITKMLGYRPEELIGRSAFEFVHPEDAPRTRQALARAVAQLGQPVTYETRFRHKDGRWCWLCGLGTNLLEEPAVQGVVVNSRDVTAERRAQRALERYSAELERSNRELQEFAYVTSHDLREPLRKIRSFGDLLRSRHAQALDAQGVEFLDWMRDAASRMQALIDEVLAFSRIATRERVHTTVDLADAAGRAVDDLAVRVADTGGRVEIGTLPCIEADAGQMRQLFQNLIGNALKFHRPGVAPLVSVRGTVERGACRVEVADNGIGFDPRFADRIFAPFQRLHGRSEFEGSGMGLAICRRIVEHHGGSIAAYGSPGAGSTFVVSLPLHQTDREDHVTFSDPGLDEPS